MEKKKNTAHSFFFHVNVYGQLDEKGHLRDLAVDGEVDLITQALQK